jgi:hypothetical protein
VVSKKLDGRRYSDLMFLHPMGSVGHVEHSGASGEQNIDALFFKLGWAMCGFHKKRVGGGWFTLYRTCVFAYGIIYGSHNAFQCVQGHKTTMHYFSCLGGTGTDSTKSTL